MPSSDTDIVPIGMIHGRFHPFHNGHLHYAKLVVERCRFLVVGITNPDRRHLTQMTGDDARHLAISNPFTFFERYRMIQGCLLDLGMSPEAFAIVPFTIDDPLLWPDYLPSNVVHFLRDRGEWTTTKLKTLRAAGQAAQLIEDTQHLDVEGTEIRRLIKEGGDWRTRVPPATARVMEDSVFKGGFKHSDPEEPA